MNCMKCGRETISEQVFCPDCLLQMEKYPVRPGTVVQLPNRKEAPSAKKPSKRRGPAAEEQIASLKKTVRILAISLVAAIAIAAALAVPAYKHLFTEHMKIGQNYTSVSSSADTADTD